MAKQDPNPPKWDKSMGDGCSGVPNWLPGVGSMVDCCDKHDEAFHCGGGEAEFKAANKAFYDCIHKKGPCWLCHQFAKAVAWWRRAGVRKFGREHFNWLGPGMPI